MQTPNTRLIGLFFLFIFLFIFASCDQSSTVYESRGVTKDTPYATDWEKIWKDSQTLVLKKSGIVPLDHRNPNGETETMFVTISLKEGNKPILQEVWQGIEGTSGTGKTVDAVLHIQTWDSNALIAGNVSVATNNGSYLFPFYVALTP